MRLRSALDSSLRTVVLLTKKVGLSRGGEKWMKTKVRMNRACSTTRAMKSAKLRVERCGVRGEKSKTDISCS